MAIPVINSANLIGVIVGVPFAYRITATNTPTAFLATPLPANVSIDVVTGQFRGTVATAGTYTPLLSAQNDDGTGTATLTMVCTLSTGGDGGTTAIKVYQSKSWNDEEERIDYADLAAAGQVVASINPGSIATSQLMVGDVTKKVGWVGGPGVIGQLILPADLALAPVLHYSQKLGSVTMPGTEIGDVVVLSQMLGPGGVPLEEDDPLLNLTVYGTVITPDTVSIYGFIGTGTTSQVIPAFSRFNFRVFTFPA